MARRELRDDQWKRIEELLPGKASDPGRTATNNRKFVDAVLWIARTGAHWRELPEQFGTWNSVFQRYNRWAKTGVWERVFRALSGDPDFEYVMIDSTIVRAHQHAAGAKGGLKRRKPLAGRGVGYPPKFTLQSMAWAIHCALS
jgi:putative transposase